MVHHSDNTSITHTLALDRLSELVAALERVLPLMAARLEDLGMYVMVAAFWGVVLFVGLGTFVQQ